MWIIFLSLRVVFKVFCAACCSLKCRLTYMDRKEARVCVTCHSALTSGEHHCKYCKVSSLQLMKSDVRGENC